MYCTHRVCSLVLEGRGGGVCIFFIFFSWGWVRGLWTFPQGGGGYPSYSKRLGNGKETKQINEMEFNDKR